MTMRKADCGVLEALPARWKASAATSGRPNGGGAIQSASDGVSAAIRPPPAQPSASQLAGCYGKAAYPSKGAAIETHRHVRKRKGKTLGCRPYKCPHCHAWHLATPGSGL